MLKTLLSALKCAFIIFFKFVPYNYIVWIQNLFWINCSRQHLDRFNIPLIILICFNLNLLFFHLEAKTFKQKHSDSLNSLDCISGHLEDHDCERIREREKWVSLSVVAHTEDTCMCVWERERACVRVCVTEKRMSLCFFHSRPSDCFTTMPFSAFPLFLIEKIGKLSTFYLSSNSSNWSCFNITTERFTDLGKLNFPMVVHV